MKSTEKVVNYFKLNAKCDAGTPARPMKSCKKTAPIGTVVFYENVFKMPTAIRSQVYGNLSLKRFSEH
ncbi:hypothetical protein ACQ4WM_10905 [Janthinobacterium sp. RB2R34]